MTITELIEILNHIKEEHGNLNVYCWPYDGQIRPCNISKDIKPVIFPMANNEKVLFIDDGD